MILFGIVGLLLISYALWVKNEVRQDVVFLLGGIALLVYSTHIGDPVFIALQVVFLLSASVELLRLKGVWPNK